MSGRRSTAASARPSCDDIEVLRKLGAARRRAATAPLADHSRDKLIGPDVVKTGSPEAYDSSAEGSVKR